MPPKASVSTRLNPVRLNTIDYLRVQRPNRTANTPCMTAMSSMLNCWASAGYGAEGCAALENQLRKCMDTPKTKEKQRITVNYHLMRMYPKVVGPRKKGGVLG